ncbi:MAG: F0F1 ATP synthase subunit epsilon [Bacteroidales bacterium]|nr:F0F1 ATP synthase subunit epsilon [Bacteroidales bacterium]
MKSRMKNGDCILLTVLTAEATLLELAVEKVSLPAVKGRFMVLKNHAPVITSLHKGDITYMSGGVPGKLQIRNGFAEISDNKVTVCAEV